MLRTWVLPLFKNGEDAVNAKHEHEMGEPSCWVVSRIYREGICDITGETKGYGLEYCFKHLSILSLSLFFIVCSRNEKGAGGWNRTNRNGAGVAKGLSLLSVRCLTARKGRPSLRSHSPSSRGREVNGSRLRLHTLYRYASGFVLGSFTRGITKPPRVWHYEGGDFHIVDLDGLG